VWEWCWDRYGEDPRGAVTDPQGPRSGADRVLRGGSWYGFSQRCRAASRNYNVPFERVNRHGRFGFRVARTA
jgi:sulfatase modifying factor 1